MSEYTDRTAGPDLNIKTDFGDTSTTPEQKHHAQSRAEDYAYRWPLTDAERADLIDRLLGGAGVEEVRKWRAERS